MKKLTWLMKNEEDIIHIELEDLPPELEEIVITEEDLQAVTPLPMVNPANVEDLGAIEIPDIPCAICHNMIEPGQSFGKCKICGTPYHKECWDFTGGCAVLGCAGSRNAKAFQAATTL